MVKTGMSAVSNIRCGRLGSHNTTSLITHRFKLSLLFTSETETDPFVLLVCSTFNFKRLVERWPAARPQRTEPLNDYVVYAVVNFMNKVLLFNVDLKTNLKTQF